jgi:hypothetical protein
MLEELVMRCLGMLNGKIKALRYKRSEHISWKFTFRLPGSLSLSKVDLRVSRLYPTAGKGMNTMPSEEYSHSAADYIRAGLLKSFEALKTDKIDMFSDLIVKQTSRSQQEKLASCAKKASSGALASATSCHGK